MYVEDILTGGRDRGPAWRRRGLVAVAVLAAVGVVVVRHLPGDLRTAPRHAVPGFVWTEPLPRIMPGRAGGAGGPGGHLMSEVRLPVAGPRPFWFWPATGRAEPIGGLPVTGAGYTFLRVAGGWVLTRGAFARPECHICMGAPLPEYFLADRASAARWVGTADGVASGATGNPAILVYATRMAPTERPDIGYAMIFSSMTIVKVIAVQVVGLIVGAGGG